MIDGIRARRHLATMHPRDRERMAHAVVGRSDHSQAAQHHTQAHPHAQHQAAHTSHATAHGHHQSFKPPEEIASEEEKQPTTSTGGPLLPKGSKSKRGFKHFFRQRSKKWWTLFILITVLVLGGLGAGAYYLFWHQPPAAPATTQKSEEPKEPPKPTTVASNLTGLQVDPAVNQRPVTGVMIENSPDARPQSSLQLAGVVFEAIAEGGITRFLALYQDTEPGYIGPVRSVRPYYVKWALGFDAPIAHVGGSADGLALVRANKDLDQFFGPQYFWRIASRDAPHNVYTNMSNLRQYEKAKGYGKSTFTSLKRKAEAPSKTPTATSIDFNVSGALYNPHFDYDPATNSYKRSLGGVPHMEVTLNGTQQQIKPKVVVALSMPQGSQGVYTTYQTVGADVAYVFQDGKVTKGVWHKTSDKANFTFTTQDGKPLLLNPGQTWFTAVGGAHRVTYK